MKMHRALAALTAGACLTLGLAGAASAATTFADYSAVDSPSINWTSTAVGGTLSSASAVDFGFIGSTMELPATFTLSATSTSPGASYGSYVVQPDLSGSFSFIYTGSGFTYAGTSYATGANLLSSTFTSATLGGYGSAGTVLDSVSGGGGVSYTSDVLNFSLLSDNAFSIEITALSALTVSTMVDSFTGTSTGSFSGDTSGLTGGGAGGIPEPTTWVLMLIGFGGIGLTLRRKAAKPSFAAG